MIWTYEKAGWARRCLIQWAQWARESAIEPLTRFANGIQRDAEQIVSWCRHRITNARIEGFNSIFSRVILKARGIRSVDYLFLKLRQESLLQTLKERQVFAVHDHVALIDEHGNRTHIPEVLFAHFASIVRLMSERGTVTRNS